MLGSFLLHRICYPILFAIVVLCELSPDLEPCVAKCWFVPALLSLDCIGGVPHRFHQTFVQSFDKEDLKELSHHFFTLSDKICAELMIEISALC